MRGARAAILGTALAGCAAAGGGGPAPVAPAPSPLREAYGPVVDRILAASATESRAHERLRHLCDTIGHRLSGSPGLERAVAWARETMEADGLDAVRAEPVMVPRWVRGEESFHLVHPAERRLRALGLGGSVAPEGGVLEGEVVAVRGWAGLEALGAGARGRIVLVHHVMPPFEPGKDVGYGAAVDFRVNGASRAAALGAVACLVRSATARSLATPHTGMLRYADGAPRIPAAALAPEDADALLRLSEAGAAPRVRIRMEARTLPDAPSANVIGEIRGSERPEEIVLLGAHLDSWDVGQGAHDDGGPCVALMEALRLLRSLGLRPRRTIRAVLFTNEENGLAGGRNYAEVHGGETHVAAIEADSGAFRPRGFTTPFPKEGTHPALPERRAAAVAMLRPVVALLEGAGAGSLEDGGGGADIGPLEPRGVPQVGLRVDESTYFDIHHTEADTFDKVVKEDLDRCVGVLAAIAYVLADR